jgi:hypothetical protein
MSADSRDLTKRKQAVNPKILERAPWAGCRSHVGFYSVGNSCLRVYRDKQAVGAVGPAGPGDAAIQQIKIAPKDSSRSFIRECLLESRIDDYLISSKLSKP